MTHTAYDEQLGGSVDATISSTYRMRQTYGPGCARMYVLRPTVVGLTARLPRADRNQVMVEVSVANYGAHAIQVQTPGGAPVASVVPGTTVDFLLLANGSADGEWFASPATGSAMSPALDTRRIPYLISFGKGTGPNVNLRTEIAKVHDYDGVTPVSLRCTIEDGAVIGSQYAAPAPALASGVWPAGSTLMLIVGTGARIVGKGGAGGRGGNGGASLIFPGEDGGTALELSIPTSLYNYGKIQGGGGGGGGGRGGAIGAQNPGGGGGGGAGHLPSLGGAPGLLSTGQPAGTGGGGNGFIDTAGLGGNAGGQSGGNGGGPGQAGQAGSGSGGGGGDAGPAIVKAAGVVLTKRRAGTIDGPEVAL